MYTAVFAYRQPASPAETIRRARISNSIQNSAFMVPSLAVKNPKVPPVSRLSAGPSPFDSTLHLLVQLLPLLGRHSLFQKFNHDVDGMLTPEGNAAFAAKNLDQVFGSHLA
jgi:hypothetical protein